MESGIEKKEEKTPWELYERQLSNMISEMEMLIQEEKKLLERLDQALSELERHHGASPETAEQKNRIFITGQKGNRP